jgi:UDP-N-acetylglucosamine--N-acetylmuramyl-(pentapeptide) pyrophosphoryl-undecaprenol N-acetylglucosamine transferase
MEQRELHGVDWSWLGAKFMRILVAGGGTGGHVYPALAIMEGLRRHAALGASEIAYIGTQRGLEARIIPQHSWIKFLPIRARGLDRKHIGRLFMALFELPVGFLQSLYFVLRFRPQAIIGVGGYAAFPPLWWGSMFGIPTVIHEQNIKPGLTNRILACWASKVCLTHQETKKYFAKLRSEKISVTGLPVRPSLASAQPDHAQFGLEKNKPTLFVVGGSRGSEFLTQIVLEAFPKLKDAQVILVTGSQSAASEVPFPDPERRLVKVSYIEDMGSALAVADLVVCRAGATTLAELAAVGKPAILVPWPGAAENHQYENARALAESGGCLLAEESGLNAHKLATMVSELFDHRTKLDEMKRRMSVPGRTAALDHILREVEVLVHA